MILIDHKDGLLLAGFTLHPGASSFLLLAPHRWAEIPAGREASSDEMWLLCLSHSQPRNAPMSRDNVAADRQANAQAGIGFLFGIVDLVKPLENLVVMFFGNPTAKILNADMRLLLVARKMHDDSFSIGRILDYIGEQIREYLPQAVPIPKHLRLDLTLKLEVMGLHRFLHALHDVSYQSINRHPLFSID
jgi:hypothetical protein